MGVSPFGDVDVDGVRVSSSSELLSSLALLSSLELLSSSLLRGIASCGSPRLGETGASSVEAGSG